MAGYPKSGPFVAGAAPGITHTFLNQAEQWLGYAADSLITSDGNGNQTVKSTSFTRGKITQITIFSGTGPQSGVVHGCSSTPTAIFVAYWAFGGSFGVEPTTIPHAQGVGSTTTNIVAQTGYNWVAVAIVA